MRLLHSLRGRLLLAGVAGVLVAVFLGTWMLGAAFERAVASRFDARLTDELIALIGAVAMDAKGQIFLDADLPDARYRRVFSGAYWRVGEGDLALQSRSLWDAKLTPSTRPGTQRQMLRSQGPRGQSLRVATQRVQLGNASTPLMFMVAWDEADIRNEVRQFRALAAGAIGAGALLMLALMLFQIRFGLQPLIAVRQGLQAVQRGQQSGFLVESLPREVQPLAEQINALLDAHRRQVQRAKHSADDLAHALKTPLAILTAESQRPSDALPRVVTEQVERLRAMIERRLAAPAADTQARTCVQTTVVALQRTFAKIYSERALQFEIAIDPQLHFAGAADDLEEMLGNLMDNAGKWSAGRIRVTAIEEAQRLRIHVEDDGPGLPPERVDAARQRGVRLDERAPGYGHGLSIVEAIVEAHQGELELAPSELGGLRATLDLPAASAY